jgi:hypothetical protein
LGGGDGAEEEIEAAAELLAAADPDVAARVEVGRGCGSAGECKGSNCRASGCAFIG